MPRTDRRDAPPKSRPGKRAPAAPAATAEADTSGLLHNDGLFRLLIIVVTAAAFAPVLAADFTTWDDLKTIAENPALNPPALGKVLRFWDPRHPYMDLYVPVTYTVWAAVAVAAYVPPAAPGQVALNPWIYHGLNLFLHVMSALVVFAVLRRLVRHAPAAAAGALLFALHPVQVESVAWASGTKDVLWGLFGMVAVWQYLRFAEASGGATTDGSAAVAADAPGRRRAHYAVATVALVLSMLSKPTGIVIPLAAAVLDYFLLRRPVRRIAPAVLPWVVLTVPVVIAGVFAQPAHHALPDPVPWHLRPLIAADALGFYLYKLAFPVWLGIIYDRTPATVLARGWAYFTWIAPAAVAALAWAYRRRFPWLAAGLAVFWVGVAPVLGFLPFDFQGYSTVSDHYLYFAMFGPALAAAYALRRGRPGGAAAAAPVVWACAAALLVALGVRSFFQARHWRDSVTLFERAVAVNPRSGPARDSLAMAYHGAGRYDDALRAHREAARTHPDNALIRANFAATLAELGRFDEAEAEYRAALALAPGLADARTGLATLQAIRARGVSRPPATTPSGPPR